MKKAIILSVLYSQVGFFILIPLSIQLITHLHPLVIGIVWFCFSSFITFFVFLINKERIVISKQIFHVIIFLYSFGLFILLFFRPENQSYGTVNLIPFETIYFYLSKQSNFLISIYNIGANIVLFLPFGLYYRYLKMNSTMRQLLVIAICSISTIEAVQFITRRGSLDIDDLILNTLGVFIGYILSPFIRKVLIIKEATQ